MILDNFDRKNVSRVHKKTFYLKFIIKLQWLKRGNPTNFPDSTQNPKKIIETPNQSAARKSIISTFKV
jgi:hypothetical protein